jgi:transcriptional regulator of NAD metabolism
MSLRHMGVSQHMMKYGLTGHEDKAVLKRLYLVSQKIHKHYWM